MTYSVKLTPRVAPVQARARQRVADILDAAQALLETDAKVTTSTIAAQAQIPVGSIYRYFPNVHSVYRKRATVSLLSTQLAERWRAGHDGFHDGDVDDVSRMASRLFTFVEQCYFEQDGDHRDAVSVVEAVKALQADLPIYLTP